MSDVFLEWWHQTWEERNEEIENALGPVNDLVASFSWPDEPERLPGACALTLEPDEEEPHRRSDWLYLSCGLSQPCSPEHVREQRARRDARSGRGYELALLSSGPAPWANRVLFQLLTGLTEPGAAAPGPGDLIPFRVYEEEGRQCFGIGGGEGQRAMGSLRFLLVWPYRRRPLFITSTGRTEVFVATGVTGAERELAAAASPAHLVLLLERCGVGQRTALDRPCLTSDAAAMESWREISALEPGQAARHASSRL